MWSDSTSSRTSSPLHAPVAGPADQQEEPRGRSERGQRILAGIAETIPLARQGSLLRAIAHNQAQTAVLGVNQLTTGLFRALDRYTQKAFADGEKFTMLTERLLPYLPVYEILNSLRLYREPGDEYVRRIEPALPAGNSAFVALREDSGRHAHFPAAHAAGTSAQAWRRRGDFFVEGRIIRDLQPTLRPDLAVLLQPDLFNTNSKRCWSASRGRSRRSGRLKSVVLAGASRMRFRACAAKRICGDTGGVCVPSGVQELHRTGRRPALLSPRDSPSAPAPAVARTARRLSFARHGAGFSPARHAPDDEMRRFLVGGHRSIFRRCRREASRYLRVSIRCAR